MTTRERKAWLDRRRRLLKKALAMAELTMVAWCAQVGYSRAVMYGVLAGDRTSAPVDRLVARTIKRYLGETL